MTSIAFKLLIFSSIVGLLSGVLTTMEDAKPLPSQVVSGIEFLVSGMYILDPIFPIGTFFTVVAFMMAGFLTYLTLVALKDFVGKAIDSTT